MATVALVMERESAAPAVEETVVDAPTAEPTQGEQDVEAFEAAAPAVEVDSNVDVAEDESIEDALTAEEDKTLEF